MILLSQLMIQNPGVSSFPGFLEVVRKCAAGGETLMQYDLKPDYPDTPRNWEMQIEAAFYWSDR